MYDNEFHKTIYNLIEKPRIENSGDKIDDNSNKTCNKLSMIGHACNYLYKVFQKIYSHRNIGKTRLGLKINSYWKWSIKKMLYRWYENQSKKE